MCNGYDCFHRGDREDYDTTWAWYDDGCMHKLTPEDMKRIILLDQIQHHIGRITNNVYNRIQRSSSDWTGDGSAEQDCAFLEGYTANQRRDKRILTSITIDAVNKWTLNVGVAALLISGCLTQEQKLGLILGKMTLCHTCGNWMCVTPDHLTVECKVAKDSRDRCFFEGRCRGMFHVDPCLVGMKRQEGAHDERFNRLFPGLAVGGAATAPAQAARPAVSARSARPVPAQPVRPARPLRPEPRVQQTPPSRVSVAVSDPPTQKVNVNKYQDHLKLARALRRLIPVKKPSKVSRKKSQKHTSKKGKEPQVTGRQLQLPPTYRHGLLTQTPHDKPDYVSEIIYIDED